MMTMELMNYIYISRINELDTHFYVRDLQTNDPLIWYYDPEAGEWNEV